MAGFIIFLPATVPSPDQYQVIEKGYSFKISDLSVPKGITHNYRFFESMCPLTAIAVFPRESTCLTIFSFVPSAFWQLASLVPCMIDELTRPLRGHPFSTQKGGARLSFFLFPHVCLVRIVQDDDLRRPKAAEWSGSPLGELAPEASEGEERKMAGFIIFLPATVPILPICPVTPISPVQKFQDSRYPFGYMI